MDLPLPLQELLPTGYSYKLKKWTALNSNPSHFESVFLTNIYTEEEAQQWWHEFNIKSNTTMRVRATCPKTGKVNIFKIYLRCLHQGRAEKHESLKKSRSILSVKRNTNCPAGMIVAIRRVIKYSRSKKREPVDPVHPCEIQIRYVHNHPTKTADSLRFRPVSKEVEDKILSLYQDGHSPSSALETLKYDLQLKHGSSFSQIVSDRFHCPDKSFCYRLYYKHFGKDYASAAKKDMKSSLALKVSHYNNVLGDTCLAVGVSGVEYVIAACTPLMKRSHSLVQSRDLVYVEFYELVGNKDHSEHYILLLIAHTSAGGVPLGVVLATSNSAAVLTLGFQLLKQLLPEQAFGGKGTYGPHAFLIEDSDNQKIALNNVWPDSDVIICIFRILQAMWRWLWDEKHNVLKDHRLYLLYLLKTVLFASSDSEMTTKYQTICIDTISLHYSAYLLVLESLWKKRHLWAICFHELHPLQDASNYYEAAVRALKDKSFEQVRTFNMIQLLNFVVTRFDFYYETKFSNILQEKIKHIFLSYFSITIPTHVENNIKQIAGNYYIVPSENEEDKLFTVDAELNSCSCVNGLNGALCIHQYWVFLRTSSIMFKADISDPEFKQKLLYVATRPSYTNTNKTSAELNVSSGLKSTDSTKNAHLHDSLSELEKITGANSVSASNSENNATDILSHAMVQSSENCSVEQSFLDIISASSPPLMTSSSSVPCLATVPLGLESEVTRTIFSSSNSVGQESVSCSERSKVDAEKATIENSKFNSRKEKALESFEKFCLKVKDGLKNRTEDFLPALEIMMKNIERKGDSAEQIINGLSFFGIVSAPSLQTKGKKRTAPSYFNEEIIPRVHGRKMITYGKRKSIINNIKPVPTDSSGAVSNLSNQELQEITTENNLS